MTIELDPQHRAVADAATELVQSLELRGMLEMVSDNTLRPETARVLIEAMIREDDERSI